MPDDPWVPHEVMRQHLGTLFLRQRQALCPVAVAGVHVQPQVATGSPFPWDTPNLGLAPRVLQYG